MARQFLELCNIHRNTPNHPHIRSSISNKQTKRRNRAGDQSICVTEGAPMFTAEQYRAKAAESAELLKRTDVPSEIREFQRSKQSFSDLAQNEDWLADNFDKMIRSQDIRAQDGVARKTPRQQCGRRDRGAYSSLPRGGRHHAMEHHPDEAPARAFRYRRLAGRRAENSRAERANCPLSARPQG